MKPLALSTMFAQQARFDDGAAFSRFAAEAGYDAIEISHSTSPQKWRAIVESSVLPITSVHQPAPWVTGASGRGNAEYNLASVDEGERAEAVAYAATSVRWAAELGVRFVVVHLGSVTDEPGILADDRRLRELYAAGQGETEEFAGLRSALVAFREARAEPYVAAARRSLMDLAAVARPHGIALGIETRIHYHEVPHPAECEVLLDGLTEDEAGYWHDTGHAEVLHRLGLVERSLWFERLGSRCIGAHLHDVRGVGDHRAPGDGDVDWSEVGAGLAHLAGYTLEINQHQPDELVASAPAFLASVGLR